MNNETNETRDGNCISPWQINKTHQSESLSKSVQTEIYDCLVVGGGITGLTAALLLQRSGQQTVILDAHAVGYGTTGGTSAHINTFADTTYKEAESAFGKEGAKLFADAIRDGFDLIKENINALKIDCDYVSLR